MSNIGSSSGLLIQQLIYGGTVDDSQIEQKLEVQDTESRTLQEEDGIRTRPSSYVLVFEELVRIVLTHESHLLHEKELEIINRFQEFSYNTRYCLSRLLLRKPNQWHPLSSLEKYKQEIGEEGLFHSIADLCQPFDIHPNTDTVEADLDIQKEGSGPEIIDLTSDSDEEDILPAISSSCSGPTTSTPTPEETVEALLDANLSEELNLSYFCEDETKMSLSEILGRLGLDQLRDLVKITKTKTLKQNKADLISALLCNASTQSVFKFSSMRNENGVRHRQLQFSINQRISRKLSNKSMKQSQEARLREMALKQLGKCVRVNYDFHRLVQRLHIIAYRSTEHPSSLLLPALLTSFKKRSYPEYIHTRDSAIWSTREELLDYEKALELEAKIDEIADSMPQAASSILKEKLLTPSTPGPNRTAETPLKTPGSATSRVAKTPDIKGKTKAEELEEEVEETIDKKEIPESENVQKAKKIQNIFYELIYPKWQELVAARPVSSPQRTPGLERFEPGYVYTRLVCKGANALATLKEYQKEYDVLQSLLAQRIWRRGKRAHWYQRCALIQMEYLSGPRGAKDYSILLLAMEGVKQALEDEDTGLFWRPSLLRRLRRLEKTLRIPPDEVTLCIGELRKAEEVTIIAERVFPRAESSKPTLHGYFAQGKENSPVGGGVQAKPISIPPRKGKSIWRGRDNEEVNVETRALQNYEDLGFKGFHSETRILTTIYALLFWDIIFSEVRGAFETPYQTAPLDMFEDSFYPARKNLIDVRLEAIRAGHAKEILVRHDEKYREKDTWCIGLRWDICEREDLVDIVECLGGESLATICKLFCEDYGGRSSGGPDLIIWNAEKRICKFVEVKGPGDRPQENQKLWFDSLLNANAAVEICKVVDINNPKKLPTKRKRKISPATSKKRRKSASAMNGIGSSMEDEE